VVRPVAATGAVFPVRLCEQVLMIDEVLVRAMVEWFESKGVIFLWNIGNKVKEFQ